MTDNMGLIGNMTGGDNATSMAEGPNMTGGHGNVTGAKSLLPS